MDLLLPGMLFLGIITSYEDLRGKIWKVWIGLGFAYAFICYLIYFFVSGINYEVITNIFFALTAGLVAGYLMGKVMYGLLFGASAALVPLSAYQNSYWHWLPSIVLLSNIFLIGLFIVFSLLFYKIRWKNFIEMSKLFFKTVHRDVLMVILPVFALFWLVGFLRFSLVFIILLALLPYIRKIKYSIWFFLGISVLRLVFDRSVYTVDYLKEIVLLIILFRILLFLITEGFHLSGREVLPKKIPYALLIFGGVIATILLKGNILILFT